MTEPSEPAVTPKGYDGADTLSGVESDPYVMNRRYVALVVNAVALIALAAVAAMVPVPYATLKPGPVFNTLGEFDGKPLFSFDEEVKTYKTDGTLDFTTVAVSNVNADLSVFGLLKAWADRDIAVVPKSILYPDQETSEESQTQGQAELASSKDSSEVAALRALGYEVPERAAVLDVVEGAPAQGKLRKGDVITKVDGTAVTSAQNVVDAVGRVEPGAAVDITFRRDGAVDSAEITTEPSDQDKNRPRVGITLRSSFAFPIKLTNNVGEQVGGPSAGMMFALGIYDKLTPGALTGGLKVAGTGEIAPNGEVGPIGGIAQKMAGAASAGVEVFLAPAANCDEVVGNEHGLKVVKVATLDDAITALKTLAKDPEAKVPACER